MHEHVATPQLAFDFGTSHVAANEPPYRQPSLSTSYLYTTPEWRRTYSEAGHRARWKCEQCGWKSLRLHAHHIEPVATAPTKFLDLSNIKMLCPRCHRNVTMQHAAQHGWAYKFGGR